jgi:transcriptional regulator with XRE-family HTH domain
MTTDPVVVALLSRLRELREKSGITPEELDARLILGPGWVRRFESGQTVPTLDVLVVLLSALGYELSDLIADLALPAEEEVTTAAVERFLSAEETDSDMLIVHFRYADYDATYRLAGATITEFEDVIRVLRNGLASLANEGTVDEKAIKTSAVARTFLRAVELWPHANPSDIWWFVVSRAYHDPFNHPAHYARLDLGQSWKRTGGWALEEILVRHYAPALAEEGVRIIIANTAERRHYISQLAVADRLEADKMDVLLLGDNNGESRCFGVVHVKASFAERRTDDVPMSKALVDAGYCSPLWTMDCKSTPGGEPVNRGELGAPMADGADKRSAKRKDIEDDGYFSACFSYNRRTLPTPPNQPARSRIYVCDFSDPAGDTFARFVINGWKRVCDNRL